MASDSIHILLVEDNPGDARLTTEALRESSLHSEVIHVVRDGVEALCFLHHDGEFAQAPRPDLILLDLNLPKRDGRSVLAEIKGDDDLRSIPVVVLTTSRSEEDIVGSYDLKANSYVTKPMELDDFVASMKAIHSFWLETATLPNHRCDRGW